AVKGAAPSIEPIRKRHQDCLKEMGLDADLLKNELNELEVLLKGISLVKELSPRSLDYVVSFGERLSTRIIAASFTKAGIPAEQRLAPTAKPLEALSFDEASELAYYGGKVLHPSTIGPAIRKGITVRCLNTFKPDHPGTVIVAKTKPGGPGIKSIAHNLKNLI